MLVRGLLCVRVFATLCLAVHMGANEMKQCISPTAIWSILSVLPQHTVTCVLLLVKKFFDPSFNALILHLLAHISFITVPSGTEIEFFHLWFLKYVADALHFVHVLLASGEPMNDPFSPQYRKYFLNTCLPYIFLIQAAMYLRESVQWILRHFSSNYIFQCSMRSGVSYHRFCSFRCL